MRRIAVLDAPSNLGLRPPTVTSVPGCAKAPGALRDHGLLTKLNARDAGCLTPPRYDAGDWRPGDGVAMASQIAAYSRALADRIGAILDAGEFPVVLGGDCSIVLGSGLAMHRLGEAVGGRIGLVFVDGHSDFRHPGNASYVGAAAGEDLALVTGRGQADLAAIEGRRPYFRDIDVVVMGIRAQDEYRLDLQAAGIVTRPVPALRAEGAARSAQWARDQLVDCAGYWVHVDVDVLDPAVMPAVDAPSPGGIAFPELEILLAGLVESPHCLGVEITVFDPDYDPDGAYAEEIVTAVTAGLAAAHTVTPRPDLIAARADLNRPEGASAPAAVLGFPARFAAAAPAEEGPDPASGPGSDFASDLASSGVEERPEDTADDRTVPEDEREPAEDSRRESVGGLNRPRLADRLNSLDLTAGFKRPERAAGLNRPEPGGLRGAEPGGLRGAESSGRSGSATEGFNRSALDEPGDAEPADLNRSELGGLDRSAPGGMDRSEPDGPDTSTSDGPDRSGGVERSESAELEDAGPGESDHTESAGSGHFGLGGLDRAGLTPGLDRAGLAAGLRRSGPPTGLNRPEPKARPLSVVADDEDATGREAHEREWERRRAAGTAGSVSLAAAGMSDGLPEAPEEVAIPATTLLGVQEGDDLPAEQPGGDLSAEQPGGDLLAEQAGGTDARWEADDEDDKFAQARDGDEDHSRTSGDYEETGRADFDGVESAHADPDDPEPAQLDAEGEQFRRSDADLAQDHAEDEQLAPVGDEIPNATPSDEADLEAPDSPVEADETTASSDEEPSGADVNRRVARPLGQAPLLDSEPLPATRPGMLRPRAPEERDSFSLPVQRPAFELGSDEPADIV